jgi:hypothetical protein
MAQSNILIKEGGRERQMQLFVVSRNRQNRLTVLYRKSDLSIPRNETAEKKQTDLGIYI